MEMIIDKQLLFKTNTCLKYRKKSEQYYQIEHLLNGKVFVVGSQVVSLLKWFMTPRSIDEIERDLINVGQISWEDLRKTMKMLVGKDILVNLTQETEAYHISSLNNRIFNVEEFFIEKATDNQIVTIGIPFGKGNNTSSGSAKFPFYIRDFLKNHLVDFSQNIENVDFRFINSKADFSNLKNLFVNKRMKDWGNLFIYPQESNQITYQKIYQLSKDLTFKGHIPLFLGGDHSISYPIIKGLAENYQNLHVIHFDAHTDTYESPINKYFEEKNAAHHHGNFVSHCLKLKNVEHFHQFGIRGIMNARYENLPKRQIYWNDALKEIIDSGSFDGIPEGSPIYVTFDIDFLDPAFAPGTATPITGGLSLNETYKLLDVILHKKNIVGIDLVEVNPDFDRNAQTIQIATDLILTLINFVEMKL
jgi:agmatinase